MQYEEVARLCAGHRHISRHRTMPPYSTAFGTLYFPKGNIECGQVRPSSDISSYWGFWLFIASCERNAERNKTELITFTRDGRNHTDECLITKQGNLSKAWTSLGRKRLWWEVRRWCARDSVDNTTRTKTPCKTILCKFYLWQRENGRWGIKSRQ